MSNDISALFLAMSSARVKVFQHLQLRKISRFPIILPSVFIVALLLSPLTPPMTITTPEGASLQLGCPL